MMHITRAAVAQEMFKLVDGLRNVGVPDAINHINALIGVSVIKAEAMNVVPVRLRAWRSRTRNQRRDENNEDENKAAQEN